MPSPYRVLTIGYSQSGQLTRILESICSPIEQAGIKITRAKIVSRQDYPFPWPFLQFFNTFPETVYEDPQDVELVFDPDTPKPDAAFDLVILGYQVWFLSPSRPVSSFLQTPMAKELLSGRRVVTVIGCRNMWLMAQERMKKHLDRLGASLIDNIVLTDSSHAATTFLSTPIWVLTGQRGPWLAGLIPRAGVSDQDIMQAQRFGHAIVSGLQDRPENDDAPMLTGQRAVYVNENLIQSEKAGRRSFSVWGKLLRALGPPQSFLRRSVLLGFIVFLITLILTVVPIVAVLKTLLKPLFRDQIAKERRYFAQPSGE